MHRRILLAASLALVLAACPGGKSGGGAGATPETEEEKVFYALGHMLGRQVANYNLSARELEVVKAGLTDSATGTKPKIEIDTYRSKLGEIARARSMAKANAEKERGKAYAEKAAGEKGAVKTESGLVYIELTAGTGASPEKTDMVKVNYRGTLTDGTEFDSSYKRNQPAEFGLNQVVPCWTEGMQKMKVGGKAKLVCPSTIAYGDFGRPNIPGGATLVFEIELLDIVKKPEPPAAPSTPGAPPPMPPGAGPKVPGAPMMPMAPGGMAPRPPGAPMMPMAPGGMAPRPPGAPMMPAVPGAPAPAAPAPKAPGAPQQK